MELGIASTSAVGRCYGSPRAGLSLAAATDRRGKPVREAVAILAGGCRDEQLSEVFSHTFSPQVRHEAQGVAAEFLRLRTAWNLASVWLTAKMSNGFPGRLGFREAELWFRGGLQIPAPLLSEQMSSERISRAEQLLGGIVLDTEFEALLPYIIEQHGPGSRASVMKNPITASAREAKRQKGVFYSPADVADYVVQHTRQMYAGNFLTARILDPACGTGVFLLAALRNAVRHRGSETTFSRLDYATSCLYGLDVNGQALDGAAFVLLKECYPDILERGLSPLNAWHSIRRNLVEADALCVDNVRQGNERLSENFFADPLPSLVDLFPQVQDGFDILIGNPPYAALGERSDFDLLTTRFASLERVTIGPRVNQFPLFVEMMWQFTKPDCNAAALVTPLSLAFHTGLLYQTCRNSVSRNGGRWQFAFFDREPHALFGEEVKTRNAIIFRFEDGSTPKRGHAADIETGPLRKWTSRTRESLFKRINFVRLDTLDITTGVPKLDGACQAEAFMKLRPRLDRLPSMAVRIGKCKPAEALIGEDAPKVFLGGTAYNFLNVYRPTSLLPDEQNIPLGESPIHYLDFKNEVEARAAFAILSSRLVFWLWCVLGDGFHVSSWLFKTIPFSKDSFTTNEFNLLSHLGNSLWHKLQNQRFTSLNGGKQTIGFRSLACHDERDRIDTILSKAAGLDDGFPAELGRFVQQNAVIDSGDERRSRVKLHFPQETKASAKLPTIETKREKQTDQRGVARIHQDCLANSKHVRP